MCLKLLCWISAIKDELRDKSKVVMKMEVESGSRMEKVSDNSVCSVSALSEGKVTFISQTHSFLLQHHFDLTN